MNHQISKGSPPLSTDRNGGFTFVEVLVSIAILTTIGLAFYSAMTGNLKAILNMNGVAEDNAKMLYAENRIRYHLNRVHIPIWVPELELPSDGSEVPYYLGYENFLLRFTMEYDPETYLYFLVISGDPIDIPADIPIPDPEEFPEFNGFSERLGPFKEIRITVEGEYKNPEALNFTLLTDYYGYDDGTIYRRFGGMPLWIE